MLKLPYPVKITLIEEPLLPCSQGYKVGQHWIVDEPTVPDDFCASFWDVCHPVVMAIGYGIEHPIPHMTDKTRMLVSCADRRCRVVFEVKRLEAPLSPDRPSREERF